MSHYFIVDDVITESGREGFSLMFGDPYEATGHSVHDAFTLHECLAKIPAGELVFRVWLARRHGAHRVVHIGVPEFGVDNWFFREPTVASIGDKFCVIGTQYGYVHTCAGDVRTWRTQSSARRFARAYTGL